MNRLGRSCDCYVLRGGARPSKPSGAASLPRSACNQCARRAKVELIEGVDMAKTINSWTGLVLLSLGAAGFGGDCGGGDKCELVDVDDVWWAAWASPETIDAELPTMTLAPRSSDCLRQISAEGLQLEQDKLMECGVIVSGSAGWNDCHEEAEGHHTRAVIAADLANAIDGQGRFDQSSGGVYLALTKSVLPATWGPFIADLRSASPAFVCELCN